MFSEVFIVSERVIGESALSRFSNHVKPLYNVFEYTKHEKRK